MLAQVSQASPRPDEKASVDELGQEGGHVALDLVDGSLRPLGDSIGDAARVGDLRFLPDQRRDIAEDDDRPVRDSRDVDDALARLDRHIWAPYER